MAFYMSNTSIINNSAQIDWSNVIDRPQYISSIVQQVTGDGTIGGYSYNISYANGVLTNYVNTNCTVNCNCGGGGDGG